MLSLIFCRRSNPALHKATTGPKSEADISEAKNLRDVSLLQNIEKSADHYNRAVVMLKYIDRLSLFRSVVITEAWHSRTVLTSDCDKPSKCYTRYNSNSEMFRQAWMKFVLSQYVALNRESKIDTLKETLKLGASDW